jgi:nucleotide-binding universal stress UspA family protein
LRILTVLYKPPDGVQDDEFREHQGQERLRQATALAERAGVVAETICARGNVPATILRTAADGLCDLLVLGARTLAGKRLRLGEIANLVAAKVSQPVLVVKRPSQEAMATAFGRRLLVATGGSPWSDDAVDHAILLALIEHLNICLLHVVSGPSRSRDDVTVMEGRHMLARGETRAADAGVTTKAILAFGDVAHQIVQTATQEQCDCIVMGARGITGWKRVMLGSICNTVAGATPLPVLLVKHF